MTRAHDYLILSIAVTSAMLVCVQAPISWAIAVPTWALMTYLENYELPRTWPREPSAVWYCLSVVTILMGRWIGHRVAYGLLYFAAFILMNGAMRTWLKFHEFKRQLETVQAEVAEIRLSTPKEVETAMKAELEKWKQQDGWLTDEFRISTERLIALIPKEGMQPPEFFRNERIRREFRSGIDRAKARIDIESPWLSRRALKDLFRPIEAALKRGVQVRIVYGYPAVNDKEDETEHVATILQQRWNRYGALFKMIHGNTHIKSFICDDEFLLVGSFNFLSFAGEYNAGTRSEMVVKIRDKKAIDNLRARAFDF
jgi:hypothetical protein